MIRFDDCPGATADAFAGVFHEHVAVAEELVHRAPDHQAVPQDAEQVLVALPRQWLGMIHHIFLHI